MLEWKYLVFVLIFVLVNACVFFGPSEKKLFSRAVSKKPYDVIIVPGSPYDSALGWSVAMKGRLYWSKYLYENGIAKNIIYSGSAVYSPYKEAEIMAMYAEKLGIPAEHIYAETKAEHSTENVYYAYYMAKKLGFEKIAVATDPFQARLLRHYPARIKVEIDFIPFVLDTMKTIKKEDFIKIDAEKARVKNFVSIVDRESRFKRFWGTMGRNIERVKEDVRNK
jgi:uncharacterized SAM-binding protein YcdF (DUF218 family)